MKDRLYIWLIYSCGFVIMGLVLGVFLGLDSTLKLILWGVGMGAVSILVFGRILGRGSSVDVDEWMSRYDEVDEFDKLIAQRKKEPLPKKNVVSRGADAKLEKSSSESEVNQKA